MYKSRLQELCQRRSWGLPEYSTTKGGHDHMPRFTATVNVHGQVFKTPAECRSSKDAQNTVARIAFEHFTAPQPPAPEPQQVQRNSLPVTPPPVVVDSYSPSPAASVPAPLPVNSPPNIVPAAQETIPESPLPSSLPLPRELLSPKGDVKFKPELQQNCEKEDPKDTSSVHKMAICSNDKSYKETLHMYKNRLQQYAQKQNIGFPVYTCEVEGPPHARRFRSRVTLNGKSYETVEFFPTLKEAEQAAAKVACQVLSADGIQEDSGLYKNLLQEFTQKKGLMCPSYETISSGVSHVPVFVSKVEIGSHTFKGDEARTKKQAEMNAAKVAYRTLTESHRIVESATLSSSGVVENSVHSIQGMSPPKRHHGGIGEEAQNEAKKAKALPENVNVNAYMPGPANPPSSALSQQLADAKSSDKRKTVVVPRTLNPKVPEGAEVRPFSDDKWLCYVIEPTKETAP